MKPCFCTMTLTQTNVWKTREMFFPLIVLQEANSLGFIIRKDEVKVDPSKIEAIASWLIPTSIIQVRSVNG